MGQQQLLLLVLGIVIVGLAVVVGIQAFGENQKKANSDALVNDAIRIASDTQAWKLKPAAFGGGANVTGMTGLTMAQLGYETTGTGSSERYTNLNGGFQLEASNTSAIITAQDSSGLDNFVKVGVFGTDPECIATAIGTTEPSDPSNPDATNCTL